MAPPLAGFNQPAAFAQAPPMTQPAPAGFAPGKFILEKQKVKKWNKVKKQDIIEKLL